MKKLNKIVLYSIAIGFVIIIALSVWAISLMGYSTANHKKSDIQQTLDSIISRIESYNESNNALPEAMSHLNFEQTINGYLYQGNKGIDIRFRYYNLSDGSYLVEIFNAQEDSIVNQFYSPNHRWESEPDNMVWFKLETKAYELFQIEKIHDTLCPASSKRLSIPFTLDSVKRNDNILSILSDCTIHCDSIGYLTVKSPNKRTRMEGWTAFDRYVEPSESLGHLFGEWKYYDEQGNCYRKFWNYIKGDTLIFEADQ